MNSHPTRTFITILATLLTLWLAACSDDDPADPGDDGPFTGTIHIRDSNFSPANATISVGDSVTWVWDGNLPHTVTHGTSPTVPPLASKLFDSPQQSNGNFGFRFTTAGSVQYFCRVHVAMGMRGTVTVQP